MGLFSGRCDGAGGGGGGGGGWRRVAAAGGGDRRCVDVAEQPVRSDEHGARTQRRVEGDGLGAPRPQAPPAL